jgi:hypothetical protein
MRLRSESGTGWRLSIEDEILIGEFTDAEAFEEAERIREAFAELLETYSAAAYVSCIEMDGAAGRQMLDGAEKAAQRASDHGLERWGIADPGIGKLAVKNRVDVPGIEVECFDSPEAAIEWAKGG